MSAAGQTGPWSISDMRTSFLLIVGGVGAAFVAWWGSSGTGEVDRQVVWTIVSVVAVMAIGTASFSWLVAGRRAVALRRTKLVDRLEAALGRHVDGEEVPDERSVVVIDGSLRFHRDGCLLVRGKNVTRHPVDLPSTENLRPCEMCRP